MLVSLSANDGHRTSPLECRRGLGPTLFETLAPNNLRRTRSRACPTHAGSPRFCTATSMSLLLGRRLPHPALCLPPCGTRHGASKPLAQAAAAVHEIQSLWTDNLGTERATLIWRKIHRRKNFCFLGKSNRLLHAPMCDCLCHRTG
jgi:hypothetical protein